METIAETTEEATRRGQQVPVTRGEVFSLYLERQRALASRSNATLAVSRASTVGLREEFLKTSMAPFRLIEDQEGLR